MEYEIEIHQLDDWEALYVNGTAAAQGHSRTFDRWLQDQTFPLTIKSMVTEYHSGDSVSEYGENSGCLPDTLAELRSLS